MKTRLPDIPPQRQGRSRLPELQMTQLKPIVSELFGLGISVTASDFAQPEVWDAMIGSCSVQTHRRSSSAMRNLTSACGGALGCRCPGLDPASIAVRTAMEIHALHAGSGATDLGSYPSLRSRP